jgi:hypothetical protein
MNDLIQPGYYTCEILEPNSGWFGESSKGSIYVRLPLRIVSPTVSGTLVWKGYISSEKAEARTIRQLRDALNVPNNWFELLAQNDQFLVGEKVSVTVEHETGTDGKVRAVAQWINSLERAGAATAVAPVAKNKLDALARRMAAMTKAVAAEGGAAPAASLPAPAPRRPVVSAPVEDYADDDIPF